MNYYVLIFLLLLVSKSATADTEKNTARIVKFYGKVYLFINPSSSKSGKGPFAKFEDQYYQVRKAKRGSTLEPNERIQTSKKAKAKLIYPNGDQITVAANTSYTVKVDSEAGTKKPIFEMLFGKIRGIIRTGGDRAGMKVRTSSMVMGVRGTDFFVQARGNSGASEISVIRGQVEVATRGAEKEKPVIVPAGFSVAVPKMEKEPKKKAEPSLKVKPTNKSTMAGIYKDSVMNTQKQEKEEPLDADMEATLKVLEQKAVENMKLDIKKEDPELYELIKKIPPEKLNSDTLPAVTAKKAYDAAPQGKKKKASFDDLKDFDVYDKYFKSKSDGD